jgi:hypothetical protein
MGTVGCSQIMNYHIGCMISGSWGRPLLIEEGWYGT